jgi:phosphopantetheinyl transferase
MVIPRGTLPLMTELPELTDALSARYGTVGPQAFASMNSMSSIVAAAQGDPLLTAAEINMRTIIQSQDALKQVFSPADYRAPAAAVPAAMVPTSTPDATGTGKKAKQADVAVATEPEVSAATAVFPPFEEPIQLLFEDHPYLIDHAIVRQPKDWPYQEDLNPVVPLAMTIELLAEIAKRHDPNRKIVKMAKITAYQWIGLERPFNGTIKGTWKTPDILEVNLDGYAKAEIHLGDEWPAPPPEYEGAIDVGDEILPQLDPEETYDRFAFHGPMYHVCKTQTKIGARGMIGMGWKAEGKGSLLDGMGQQLGLFLHLTQTENTISFPVRIKEIAFYADIFDQDGIFEQSMVITRLSANSIMANMIIKREAKMWCVTHEFVCQRFKNYLPVWNVILKPQYNLLAEEIAPGLYSYTNTSEDTVLGLLGKRYLNHKEIGEVDKLDSKVRQRERVVSRIALSDAVRSFVRGDREEMLYPIEIFYSHDENGKPQVHGERNAKELLEGVHVSLAHKGLTAVAVAADKPIGIDIEVIEEKSEGFKDIAFTKREQELLASLPQPEGTIRFWVAKEACAKKAGTGIKGSPKHFEVNAVDGDVLSIGDEKVQTMLLRKEYIVGWTI